MSSVLEADLTCAICQDFFKDPVVLCCSHSFCKACLIYCWKNKDIWNCPICRRRSKRSSDLPPSNLSLKNLVQTYLEQKSQSAADAQCSIHSERLKLFCVDHQQPVCLVCRDSKTHKDHRFVPIDEIAQERREQLKASMKPLKDNLQVLNKCKVKFDEAAAHISVQTRRTERLIRDQFQRLHQFLLEEEESRMKALREEEEQKTQRMKDKMAALSRDIETVSKTISETEQQLRATDTVFLKQYKTAEERVQHCPLVEEPRMDIGALIQAKHLGNLGFNIWRNMKKLVKFNPVVLDPNTAGPELLVSEDLSSVRAGGRQNLPENPCRLRGRAVLGRAWFFSGTHSWDVEVNSNNDWRIGVNYRLPRGDQEESITMLLCFRQGKYTVYTEGKFIFYTDPGSETPLTVQTLQKVTVTVDIDKQTVAFTDADTHTDLHTFTHIGKGYFMPLFCTNTNLKILPKKVMV